MFAVKVKVLTPEAAWEHAKKTGVVPEHKVVLRIEACGLFNPVAEPLIRIVLLVPIAVYLKYTVFREVVSIQLGILTLVRFSPVAPAFE